MIELAILLSLSASAPLVAPPAQPPQPQQAWPGGPDRRRAPLRCDDGSSVYHVDGSPNWDCELRNCSPHEFVCWSERLDHCYDDSGDDNGVCGARKVTSCKSRWGCFKLWANCNGEYTCTQNAWPGCAEGSCTTATLKTSPPLSGAASPAPPPARARRRAALRLPPMQTRGNVGGHDV